jgi:hypothetical protein
MACQTKTFCQDRLFWTTDLQLKSCKKDGSDIKVIKNNLRNPKGAFVDFDSNKLYWTEFLPTEINMSNLDGTNTQKVEGIGVAWPGLIIYDNKKNTFYWIELIARNLKKYSPDGGTEIIFDFFDNPLSGFVLDTCNNYLYVSIIKEGIIQRIDLNDNNSTKTIISYQGSPGGIALDIKNNLLYWGDTENGTIYQSTLNGEGIREIYTSNSTFIKSVVLDHSNNKIFWLERNEGTPKGSIKSINTDGTGFKLIVHENTSNTYDLQLLQPPPSCEIDLNEHSKNQTINIFPNPVIDYLFIQNISRYSLKIFTVDGIFLHEIESTFPRVDLTFLLSGVYILKIKSDEIEDTFKIIKI